MSRKIKYSPIEFSQISFDRHIVVKHSSLSIQVAPILFQPGAQLHRYDPTVLIQISFSKIESVSHAFSSSNSFFIIETCQS